MLTTFIGLKNAEIFVNGKFCFKLEKNQVPGRDVHVKA